AGGAGLALGALEFTPKSAARRLLQLLGLMFLTYAVAAWIGALQGADPGGHRVGQEHQAKQLQQAACGALRGEFEGAQGQAGAA
ncbi:protein-disulfide reductase DsbD, partial [Pseudomonas aeruginosa]